MPMCIRGVGGMKMEAATEKIWAWLMPSGKIYRVVSNSVGGTIKVYKPDGTLVKKYETLSEAEVHLIEQNFLGTVATMVKGKESEPGNEPKNDVTDEIALYIR
jgi:hypothetical protein